MEWEKFQTLETARVFKNLKNALNNELSQYVK